MNALTLIGAAVTCEGFCELLLKNPVEAARALGLVLTNVELKALKEAFKNEPAICKEFGRLRTFFCRRPPCPLGVVVAGLEDLCNKKAA